MNKLIIILLSFLFAMRCLGGGCDHDQIMLNGQSYKDSAIFKQFLKTQTFDYETTYHNFSEIESELNRMSHVFSNITKLFSLGKTTENRDIWAINVSINSSLTDRTIVFECGTHGREWISISFCLWIVNHLTINIELLTHYQFLIIPVLNPDGYVYTWERHRFWRKNRSKSSESRCSGVDINRNWDTPEFCIHSSKRVPCHDLYCGDQPFSSPEAKALSDYLLANRNHLFAHFSIHSFNQLWMYPRGYTEDPVPNADFLEKLSQLAVKEIFSLFGARYKAGPFSRVLYKSSGVSSDWVYDKLGVKIVFAIELRDDGGYGFLLPCYLIKPSCEETWKGINAVLNHLIKNGFKIGVDSQQTDTYYDYSSETEPTDPLTSPFPSTPDPSYKNLSIITSNNSRIVSNFILIIILMSVRTGMV